LIGGNGAQGPVWAQQFTYAFAGANTVTNNPALVMDFDNWHVITLTYKNNILHYSLDSVEFFQLPYTGNICNIQGLDVLFKGSGDIDWTRILDANGNEVWREDFDSCSALKPFPPCVTTPPVINLSYTAPTCADDTLRLFANSSQLISYNWTGPNGFTSTEQNPVIDTPTLAANGVYTVTALTNNCSATNTTKSITVSMSALPRSFSTKDTTICQGMTFRGHISTGIYIDTIPNAVGCDSIMTLNLTVINCSCSVNKIIINTGYNPVTKTALAVGQKDTYWTVTSMSSQMQNALCYNINTTGAQAPPNSPTVPPVPLNSYADVIFGVPGTISCFPVNTIYTLRPPTTPAAGNFTYTMNIRRSFFINSSSAENVTFNFTTVCDDAIDSIIIDSGLPSQIVLLNTMTKTVGTGSPLNTNYTTSLSPGPHTLSIQCANWEDPTGGNYYPVTVNGITSQYQWNPFEVNVTGSISTVNNVLVNDSCCVTTTSTIDTTICLGQNYFGYTSTGTYVDTLANARGCDSIRTVNLTVNTCAAPSPSCEGTIIVGGLNEVSLPDPQTQYYSSNGFTWECWFNGSWFNNTDNTFRFGQALITTEDPALCEDIGLGFGWASFPRNAIGFNIDGPGLCANRDNNPCYYLPPGGFQPNTWYHVAAVRDYTNNTASLYLNGVLVNTKSNTLLPFTRGIKTRLGIDANVGGDSSFTGKMDEIRIWNYPRTAVEISTNYNQCLTGNEPGLVTYYHANEAMGLIVHDVSPNHNDGILDPGVTWDKTDNAPLLNSCGSPSTSTIDTTICNGQNYFGHTSTGTYIDTYTNARGCDSARTLHLTVKPKSFSTFTTTICEGQAYFGYTTTGIHIDTLVAANGCDSVRTINLTVNKKTYDTITVAICQGQSYLGYTATGSYNDTLVNAAGCDSITTLNLTINNNCTAAPTCNGSLGNPVVNITFGSGNNPGAALPAGTTTYSYIPVTGTPPALIPDGFYSLVNEVPLLPGWFSGAKDHTGNPNGYMAFFNASPTTGVFYQQSITGLCAGTKYQFSTWIANVVDAGAISGGSMQPNITLELINSSNNTVLGLINTGDIPNATAMTWQQFGMLFTMPAGVSNLTLVLKNNNIGGSSVQGNDFAIDDISFSPCGPQTLASFSSSKITDTICANSPIGLFGTVSPGLIAPAYQWQISNGSTGIFTNIPGANSLNYTLTPGLASGNYSFTLLSAEAANIGIASCRYSSNIINLNVKPTFATTITTSICQGQNYAGYTTSGTFIDNLTAINGCDSIRTINLTVNVKSYDTLTITLCEEQSFRGHTITGTYNDTIPNTVGCDSIMTLHLNIKPKSFATFTATICDGQTYLGYNTTGVHKDTLVAVNGCDSIRTINLTVTPSSRSTLTTSICQGQSYLGYNVSGVFIDTLIAASAAGCDSIRTLHLTVIPSAHSSITKTICQGQRFLGYTNSGTFIDTLFAASVTGCDSIRTLSLTVNAKSYDTLTASICQGQSYLGYTTSGIYNDTLTNAVGCDSIRTVQLTVNSIPLVKTNKDTSICIGTPLQINTTGATTYTWSPLTSLSFPDNTSDPVTNTTTPIRYIVIGTTNGCSASDTLNIGINQIPVLSKSDNVTICKDSSTTIYVNGGLNFQWSPNNTLSFPHNVNAPVAAPLVTTVYHVLVTDANNCVNTDSIKVTVRPDAVFTISPGTGACANISTQLLAGGGDTYLWSPATLVSNATIKNPTTAITATTTYTVQIKEKTCGTSADLNTTLTLLPALNLVVSKSNDLDCYTPSATLSAFGADKYVWSPATGLNNVNVAEPIAKPFSTQQYFVTGTDKNGCVGQDSIIVFGNYADRMIYDMANAFTPNNDGKNDCFGVKYFGVISDFTFMIYNRWGQQMFYTNDPTACWDGTFQGQKVDQDTYVYYLKAVTACGTAEKKGTVVLLR